VTHQGLWALMAAEPPPPSQHRLHTHSPWKTIPSVAPYTFPQARSRTRSPRCPCCSPDAPTALAAAACVAKAPGAPQPSSAPKATADWMSRPAYAYHEQSAEQHNPHTWSDTGESEMSLSRQRGNLGHFLKTSIQVSRHFVGYLLRRWRACGGGTCASWTWTRVCAPVMPVCFGAHAQQISRRDQWGVLGTRKRRRIKLQGRVRTDYRRTPFLIPHPAVSTTETLFLPFLSLLQCLTSALYASAANDWSAPNVTPPPPPPPPPGPPGGTC